MHKFHVYKFKYFPSNFFYCKILQNKFETILLLKLHKLKARWQKKKKKIKKIDFTARDDAYTVSDFNELLNKCSD